MLTRLTSARSALLCLLISTHCLSTLSHCLLPNLSLPTGCPCCASCALWHHIAFRNSCHAFAYSSLPTGCPCCASCALWHHCLSIFTHCLSIFTHCLLIFTHCLLPTRLCPLDAPAVPPGPCGITDSASFRRPPLGVHLCLLREYTTWRHGCGCAVRCMRTPMTAVLHQQAGCIPAGCR